jgi:hypothetical protein
MRPGGFAPWRLTRACSVDPMTENQVSKVIVEAAIEAHRQLGGPGLIEDIYEEALAEELSLRDVRVERQLPVRLTCA